MVDPTSRYAAVAVATTTVPDGRGGQREVRFLRRRFLPPLAGRQVLAEHPVASGDRIDVITATYLGDPTQFWRICDANLARHPDQLTVPDRIGETIVVPVPQA